MGKVRGTFALLAAAALVLSGCGGGGGASTQTSVDELPWGLDSVTLPDDVASVEDLLMSMPQRGRTSVRMELPGDWAEVGYEEGFIRAMRLGPETPAETALGYLRLLSEGGEVQVEDERLAEDARLVYQAYTTDGGSYVIAWGVPRSEWLFVANARSPDARRALVDAFVNACALA